MIHSMDSSRANLLAALGALLSLPALVLFVSGMIQSATGYETTIPGFFDRPVAILGGLLGAIVLNAFVTVRPGLRSETDGYIVEVRLIRRWASLLVLGLAGFLLAAILLYGFAENFTFTPH